MKDMISITQKIAQLETAISATTKRIAPTWPLKNMVAVNPYYGFTNKSFYETSKLLSSISTNEMFMPLSFYKSQIDEGKITLIDIQQALNLFEISDITPELLLFEVHEHLQNKTNSELQKAKTIADLVEDITSTKTNNIRTECITNWLSMHFNEVDLSWRKQYPRNNVYNSWREFATCDLTPNALGLKNFKQELLALPSSIDEVHKLISNEFEGESERLQNYMLQLLMCFPGWSSYIAGIDWDNNLYGTPSKCLHEFILVLMAWEYCLKRSSNSEEIDRKWKLEYQLKTNVSSNFKNSELEIRSILQTAFDFSKQRMLVQQFNQRNSNENQVQQPIAQTIFCIDVRSEVYRRHLEMANKKVHTIGFAGFFGFPVRFERPGTNVSLNQCPVLLPANFKVTEPINSRKNSVITLPKTKEISIKRIVKGYRKSPISSFGFVSPLGLFYLPKLLSSSFKEIQWLSSKSVSKRMHIIELNRDISVANIPLPERIKMARNALRGIGLTKDFAPIVAFVGHGSSGVNNPHNSGLACGACGGNAGDINALTAAKLLNDERIRVALIADGIEIPSTTTFLAALHDTAVDSITILNKDVINSNNHDAYRELLDSFNSASKTTRIERGVRFFQPDPDKAFKLMNRNLDWGQTRPEWGLAKCSSFIIAQRARSKGIDLGGESFLHDYDFNKDEGLKLLESIMTAPMIVTSWINLQYYASAVDNNTFGSGNKTLHNVTSGIGVIEGSTGDLRIGLPYQSVHNGKTFEHLPYRLNVIIDAPMDAINSILEKHQNVRQLFDNQWIQLLRMDSNGRIVQRYLEQLRWEQIV